MGYSVLVLWRRLNFCRFVTTHGERLNLRLLRFLLFLFLLHIDNGLRNFRLCFLRLSSLEVRHAHIEVRAVRVVRLEESELRAALLALHALFEALPMLCHELSSGIDHTADV